MRQVPKQDIVIHIAGITHSKYSKKYVSGNVKSTENLISHFKNLNIKHFIFLVAGVQINFLEPMVFQS